MLIENFSLIGKVNKRFNFCFVSKIFVYREVYKG